MIRRLFALAVVTTAAFASTTQTERRVYHFRCMDDRQTLYAADVEGPPDTDFKITLRDARHEIEAAFVNEPLPSGGITSRIHLKSRRAWGLSPNGLPLWEEDDQRQRADVGPDEQIDLLPFGGKGDAGLLRIEITPQDISSAEPSKPLSIHILQGAPHGAINVYAYRVPHWYATDIALMRNGAAVAHASSRLFIDEGSTVALESMRVHITPSTVPYANPAEFVAIHVDTPSAHDSAAVVLAGSPFSMPVSDTEQLVITVRPEKGSV